MADKNSGVEHEFLTRINRAGLDLRGDLFRRTGVGRHRGDDGPEYIVRLFRHRRICYSPSIPDLVPSAIHPASRVSSP
jgi:hypothetical protein